MNETKIEFLSDEWWHEYEAVQLGTFINEGLIIALPLCFPELTVPIPAAESCITSLDVTDDGVIYGGTSGSASHAFVARVHSVSGHVLDLGKLDDCISCPAIVCGKNNVIICANNNDTGKIFIQKMGSMPGDDIQECVFVKYPIENIGVPIKNEQILHAVADKNRNFIIGTTPNYIFKVDIDKKEISILSEAKNIGKLVLGSNGTIYGMEEDNSLWKYDSTMGNIIRKEIFLPGEHWNNGTSCWTRDLNSNGLYIADSHGQIYHFTEKDKYFTPIAKCMSGPVTTMSVTFDGRLFGFCGEGISSLFCYNPKTKTLKNLGCAASTIGKRRLGYIFGDSVVGRDGYIVFGENDNFGHLWLYFPRIMG